MEVFVWFLIVSLEEASINYVLGMNSQCCSGSYSDQKLYWRSRIGMVTCGFLEGESKYGVVLGDALARRFSMCWGHR